MTSKISEFTTDPHNANKGTQRGLKALDTSLRQYGAGRSILVDKNGKVIAGNKTLERAADIGIEDAVVVQTDGKQLVVVQRTDLDLENDGGKARALATYDNRVGQLDLDWDIDALKDVDSDVLKDLWTVDELDKAGIIAKPMGDAEPQIDRAAELQEKWQVKTGDLWRIGEHRLLCGDSTKREDVERVMRGEKADMVLTDPPYSVDYGAKNRALQTIGPSNRLTEDISGDTMDTEETAEKIWKPSFTNAYEFSRNGTVIYCFAPQGGDQMMMMMMIRALWNKKLHQLIWNKNFPTFSMGRLDYQYQHEPILYSWRGTNHGYYGEVGRSVINIDRPSASKLHPTMKPIELLEIFINNSSQNKEIIFDLFTGSGSTIVACQNLGRKCRAIEISPEYCAVTLERMATAFQGIEIERIGDS